MRVWQFILVIAVIFFAERLLPFLFFRPMFIFPVFVILFLLASDDFGRDIIRVIIASLFFDLFSGFSLGYFTLAITVMGVSVYFIKKQFMVVSGWSYIWGILFFCLLIIEFLAMSSVLISRSYLLEKLPVILLEGVVLYLVMLVIFKKMRLILTK